MKLHGKGFESLVKVGDQVEVGTPLCKVEKALIDGDIPLYTPMIIVGSDEMVDLKFKTGNVVAGKDCVIEYKK